jgi:hypothetical protein
MLMAALRIGVHEVLLVSETQGGLCAASHLVRMTSTSPAPRPGWNAVLGFNWWWRVRGNCSRNSGWQSWLVECLLPLLCTLPESLPDCFAQAPSVTGLQPAGEALAAMAAMASLRESPPWAAYGLGMVWAGCLPAPTSGGAARHWPSG